MSAGRIDEPEHLRDGKAAGVNRTFTRLAALPPDDLMVPPKKRDRFSNRFRVALSGGGVRNYGLGPPPASSFMKNRKSMADRT